MPVSYTCQNRAMTALLSGEIDHHGARDIMGELTRAIRQELPVRLTLDLSGVTFMDSSGIAVLIRAKREMDALGGAMKAEAIPVQPRRVLDAAGLGQIIPLE